MFSSDDVKDDDIKDDDIKDDDIKDDYIKNDYAGDKNIRRISIYLFKEKLHTIAFFTIFSARLNAFPNAIAKAFSSMVCPGARDMRTRDGCRLTGSS